MPDVIDDANERAECFRDVALHNHQMARKDLNDGDHLIISGVRCCLDCEAPIPKARLKAAPQATRCVVCQAIKEKK